MLSKVYVPVTSPDDWQGLLAQPNKQWRTGYSAKALAHAWMKDSDDFPSSVRRVFGSSGIEVFSKISMLLAFPEYKTALPGGRRASQSDVFVLAEFGTELVTIAVEGKVDEPFGEKVSEWLVGASPGRLKRLRFLCRCLGLAPDGVGDIRYQLLHRTASALVEAAKFNAAHALMLVHSFSQTNESFEDFAQFATLFNAKVTPDSIVWAGRPSEVDLYLGWVKGEEEYLRA